MLETDKEFAASILENFHRYMVWRAGPVDLGVISRMVRTDRALQFF